MKRGDIYMVSLDPTMGHEQRGQRPVLVISPTKFDAVTKLPVVLPITSGGDFAGASASQFQSQASRQSRSRPLRPAARARSSGARSRKVDALPREILDEVLAKGRYAF